MRILWLFAALATACSSSQTEATTAPNDLASDVFAKQLAETICADATGCCKPIADCQSATEKKIRDAITPSFTYDGKAANGCIAAYRALPACTDRTTASSLTACNGVVDGKKNPGESCESPEECKRAGLGFNTKSGFVGCGAPVKDGPRVCIAFRPTDQEGASCNENLEGDGFERVVCKSGLSCASGKCVKQPAVGEACPTSSCQSGSTCEMGTCRALPAVGAPCEGSCADGTICTSGTCTKEPNIIPFACIGFACPSDGVCM